MNKEKQLYNYIKSTFIDEQLKKDYEEKTKNAKQIIKLCKEKYGFDDEVVIKIFKRIYYSTERQKRLNNYNKEHMIGIADTWYRNNIRKKEDVEKYYKKLEKDIMAITNRDITTYEKICIEELLYRYKIKEIDFIEKIKENGKLDINELEKEYRR